MLKWGFEYWTPKNTDSSAYQKHMLNIHIQTFCLIFRWSSESNQVVIAQWLARQVATSEVPGSNPGKGEKLVDFWLKKEI